VTKHVFITGGAGFIGINSARMLLERGYEVTIYDNFLRRGSRDNVSWLEQVHPGKFHVVNGSLTDFDKLSTDILSADAVLHLAAQVAVTTSVVNPRLDFDINCLGSFNVLEACRLSPKKPLAIYTSTNKVYGGLEHLGILEQQTRYAYADQPEGVAETEPLDFHSPYGCSKGAADQYFRDYARIYDLPTVVLRQSCIYGLRQFGNEDQGWVAHFVISAALGRPLSIYGDGKQVRDLLWVEDLCELYIRCIDNPEAVSGRIYNIGGGPPFTLSLLELIELMEEALGRRIQPAFGPWRPGDQRTYVSNVAAITRDIGWRPTTPPATGVRRLIDWVRANPALFSSHQSQSPSLAASASGARS
jgi:CDP-paratose 2-epimerase